MRSWETQLSFQTPFMSNRDHRVDATRPARAYITRAVGIVASFHRGFLIDQTQVWLITLVMGLLF